MTFHLYAVTEPAVELPHVPGIDGSRLERVAVDGLAAVVSDVARANEATEEAILAHAAVVEALTLGGGGAVLPARFARGYDTQAAVAAAVATRESQLRAALARVRGCVELGVRVLLDRPEPSAEPAQTGRAYMADRLRRVQAADRLSDELDGALAPSAAASATNVVSATPLVVTGAYLVPLGEVETFRARVDAFARGRRELTVLCTGPWPPYSFATVDATQP